GEKPSVNYEVVGSKITKQVQLHGMSEVLNVTVLSTSIIEPGNPNGTEIKLKKVAKLVMVTPPKGDVMEGKPLSVQPIFKVTDDNGDIVEHLGFLKEKWIISATFDSGNDKWSKLINASVPFEDGWANFSSLAIVFHGKYVLNFKITVLQEASKLFVKSQEIQFLKWTSTFSITSNEVYKGALKGTLAAKFNQNTGLSI
ncbi:unnamed protein product, partial [Lymnaea stagnalis]